MSCIQTVPLRAGLMQQSSPWSSLTILGSLMWFGLCPQALAAADHPGGTDMPAALRAAYTKTVQQRAGAEYALRSQAAGVVGGNREQGMALRLDAAGVHVRHGHGAGSELTLRLHQVGCSNSQSAAPIADAIPRATSNRAELTRAGVSEWYINGPLGLEQGFTLTRDPGCAAGSVAIELAVQGGYQATLTEDGSRIDLRDEASGATLHYSELMAFDADGKELPARLRVKNQTIRLEVDAAGARYPVDVDPQLWIFQQKLAPPAGASVNRYGSAVAISGDTAVIGSTESRQVYVYKRVQDKWTEQQTISYSPGESRDNFGRALALSSDTLLVGVPDANTDGQVYVYGLSGSTWIRKQILAPSDGAGFGIDFGSALALKDDTAMVSATVGTGQVYVFVRSGGTWTQQQKLTTSDALVANDHFGGSIAMSGDTAFVGASGKQVAGQVWQGQVYVYVRSGGTWTEQQKLIASDGAGGDGFGQALALSDDTAVIGAPNKQLGIRKDCGQVYIYGRSGNTWTEQQKLIASDGTTNGLFGSEIALSGSLAFISADQAASQSPHQGQVYVYTRAGSTWTEQQKLTKPNGASFDYFGYAIAVSGDTAVIGINGADNLRGQAYIYVSRLVNENGASCGAGSECASGSCVDGVCCNTECGGGAADCQSCLGSQTGLGQNGICGAVASDECSTSMPNPDSGSQGTGCTLAPATAPGSAGSQGSNAAAAGWAATLAGAVLLAFLRRRFQGRVA